MFSKPVTSLDSFLLQFGPFSWLILRKLGLFPCAMTITPYCSLKMYFMKQRGHGPFSNGITFLFCPDFSRILNTGTARSLNTNFAILNRD